MRRARDSAEVNFGLAAVTYGFVCGWLVGVLLWLWVTG